MEYRIEKDTMGEVKVPADAYYGAQTARAVENFPISDLRFSRSFIRALGLIKKHAAAVNAALKLLPPNIAEAIQKAAAEVTEGKWDSEFVVDIFQTGSGTSTNMNANEVIANRAVEILGGKRGDKSVHPNDHVNRGQSSNDVIPAAIHLAALEGISRRLAPALGQLRDGRRRKMSLIGDMSRRQGAEDHCLGRRIDADKWQANIRTHSSHDTERMLDHRRFALARQRLEQGAQPFAEDRYRR